MDGVRRWIGSTSHSPGTRRASDKRGIPGQSETDGDGSSLEKEDIDPHSMEAIVERLLSPIVTEEAEYQQ